MLARVATFNALPGDVDPEAVALLRTTVRDTPGFVAGFHLGEPGGGKALSIVVVEDEDAARAVAQALAGRPADQRVGVEPDTVELFEAHPF
jgi:hypothetical protein